MKNVFLSLFDPLLDHANGKKSDKHKAWHPSVAPTHHDSLATITHYYLLSENEHLNAAEATAKQIRDAFAQTAKRIHDTANKKARVAFAQQLLKNPPKVEVVGINYTDVWNVSSCLKDLTNKLSELMIGNAKIFINMATGTAQQRTALVFWLLKRLHVGRKTTKPRTQKPAKNDQRQRGFFITPSTDKAHPAPAGQITLADASDNRNSIGFLRMAMNTQHPGLRNSLDQIEKLIVRAPQDPILLTGPTGAGKSHLAHLMIEYLKCLNPSYTDENCRAQNIAEISKDLIASELFGHEKGAFTGAVKGHKGLFETTKDGILFLDEIGELDLDLQAQLLTVLDNGNIRRVGGEEIISGCRPKLIFGTNRNLQEEVKAGRFRYDLYERIAMWHFEIPGIHERAADIPKFLQYELAIWRAETGINCRFDKAAESRFLSFAKDAPWAGNFREFHAMIRRLAMFSENGRTITLDAVEREIREQAAHQIECQSPASSPQSASASAYDLTDLAQIAIAIDVCKQSKTAKEAGEKLFAATRNRNPATFNGATNLQRLFAKVGLKVKFRAGTPELSQLQSAEIARDTKY